MQLLSDLIKQGDRKGPFHPPTVDCPSPFDLSDALEYQKNGPPWAVFRELRRSAPVSWQEERSYDGRGFWAVTDYENVMRVNGDPATFSSQLGGMMMAYGGPGADSMSTLGRASLNAMINMDAPWHLQLRRDHMPFFTVRYLAELKDKVTAETTRLIDAIAPQGEVDLVETLSARLPLFTLCEILGVPPADREKFLTWMHFLERAAVAAVQYRAGQIAVTPDIMQFVADFQVAVGEMFEYGRYMLHKRRDDPQPDLMSAIAAAKLEGELLVDEYLDGAWLLIVFAGNDTTRNTISGSIKLLTEFPEERRRLIADRSLIPNAANEFIRLVSPVMYMRRTATIDVELAGQKIAKGEKVVMYYNSANRDERVFPDPDRLDVGRANAERNLAFGYGPHLCLGKRVAQLQLEAVHEQLLHRLPDIHYVGGMELAPSNFVYAISKLPVAFTPERRG
jgi:cytochrome P450